MSLVKRIDALCKQRNTTLTAIERECGLGVSSIRKWDDHSPSLVKVVAVADALGVSVADLIDEQQKKPTPEDGGGLTKDKQYLIDAVRSMSDDDVRKLRLIVEEVILSRGQ